MKEIITPILSMIKILRIYLFCLTMIITCLCGATVYFVENNYYNIRQLQEEVKVLKEQIDKQSYKENICFLHVY